MRDSRAQPSRARISFSAVATRAYDSLIRHRYGATAVIDSLAWAVAVLMSGLIRFEFRSITDGPVTRMIAAAVLAGLLHLGFGWVVGLYAGRYKIGSIDEAGAVLRAVLPTGIVLGIVTLLARPIPLSVALAAPVLALVLIGGMRAVWRVSTERAQRIPSEHAERVVVFGAGIGARQVVVSMRLDPSGRFHPVAMLDDDPGKANHRIADVRVLGDRTAMARVARDLNASVLLIAIPSASAALIRELAELSAAAGLRVLVLPPIADLYGRVELSDIRTPDERDLLGRREIDTDIAAIASYLRDKRVLVTGAGGSIGAELCRQLYRMELASLIMLDRDESGLHAAQLSIAGAALLDSDELVVCDLRDRDALRMVFAHHRPQVVFHAAALKHLTLLERHPAEAVKTNIWGTQHLLDATMEFGVERFVNISTDKAADPSSVLGYTKRVTERLTATAAMRVDGHFMSVRFGNVLGSRGSVLTAFRHQIEAGGPVTVTHPDVSRYFMTVEEAVQLVIQAGAFGSRGDVFVLDMGEPVRIADLARQLIEISPHPERIEMVFTGLRDGEKLFEALIGKDEIGVVADHPLITRVSVPCMEEAFVWMIDTYDPQDELIGHLRTLSASPTAEPSLDSPMATSG